MDNRDLDYLLEKPLRADPNKTPERHRDDGRKYRADRKLPPNYVIRELLERPNKLSYAQIALLYDVSAPAVYFALYPHKRYRSDYEPRSKTVITVRPSNGG